MNKREAPHQIAPGIYVGHARFVEWLWECAGRWKAQPFGQDQAEHVADKAQTMANTAPDDCPVCRAAEKNG